MKQNTNTSFGSFNKRGVRCEIRNNTTSHREEAHNNKYRPDLWYKTCEKHFQTQ